MSAISAISLNKLRIFTRTLAHLTTFTGGRICFAINLTQTLLSVRSPHEREELLTDAMGEVACILKARAALYWLSEISLEKMLGVDLETLVSHSYAKELDPFDLLAGIEGAERYGLVRVSRMIGKTRPNIPNKPVELREIAKVSILEAGHQHCDDLLN